MLLGDIYETPKHLRHLPNQPGIVLFRRLHIYVFEYHREHVGRARDTSLSIPPRLPAF